LDPQRWQWHRRQSASIKERGRSRKHSLVACCSKIKKRLGNSRQGRLRDASSDRRRCCSDRTPQSRRRNGKSEISRHLYFPPEIKGREGKRSSRELNKGSAHDGKKHPLSTRIYSKANPKVRKGRKRCCATRRAKGGLAVCDRRQRHAHRERRPLDRGKPCSRG